MSTAHRKKIWPLVPSKLDIVLVDSVQMAGCTSKMQQRSCAMTRTAPRQPMISAALWKAGAIPTLAQQAGCRGQMEGSSSARAGCVLKEMVILEFVVKRWLLVILTYVRLAKCSSWKLPAFIV
jgi:hypothetical protein